MVGEKHKINLFLAQRPFCQGKGFDKVNPPPSGSVVKNPPAMQEMQETWV